jgi:N-acetylglutamate synthase-like GNAT family acetyltransferase
MNTTVEIIEYRDELLQHFKDLNVAWLEKYFYVEPIDEEMLSNPKAYIIDKGGYIFFATVNGNVAGTFALIKQADGSYELSKMAVDEKFQGQKVGNGMMAFCLEKAKELGAEKIILYSNTKLGPAIHLYKKFGFIEVPLGDVDYKRADIKMETVL